MSQQNFYPTGGIDYPRNLQEFDDWFSAERACIDYLFRLRWPQGFVCPVCHARKGWKIGADLIRCAACRYNVSVTAGTIFQGTRKPLKLWFQAVWHVTSQKFGGNALGLQRVLGFGSYQTAWTWLHKMRRAMVRPGRDKLKGNIEVDETLVGGADKGGKRGRGAGRKSIVVIAVEVHKPKGFGRIRMQRIPDASARTLIPFVNNSVVLGSTVLTDSWRGYNGLEQFGYIHERVKLSDSGEPAHVSMPGVHRISSLLKHWILGTHQGSISSKHLDYYMDEYTFRFNRRTSRARGLLFYRLLEQAVQVPVVTYKEMTSGQE